MNQYKYIGEEESAANRTKWNRIELGYAGVNGTNWYNKKYNRSSSIGSASKITISLILGCRERASIPIIFLQGYFHIPIGRRAHRNLNTCQ